MNLTIRGKDLEYSNYSTLHDIARDFEGEEKDPIILAVVNGKLRELFHSPREGATVDFLTTATRIGHETYRRSCIMLFLTAVHNVTMGEGVDRVVLHFSVDAGFYFTIEGARPVDQAFADQIEAEMRRLVSMGLPFNKSSFSTAEAQHLFHDLRLYDKEKLFATRLDSRVNVYTLDSYSDYFYGFMAFDTSVLKYFKLHLYEGGIVLQMPERRNPSLVPSFRPYEKLFRERCEGERWARRQKISTVGDLNEHIIDEGARRTILVSEAMMDSRIASTARKIIERTDVRFVMVAGPSSSGKTTFAQKLGIQLAARGLVPHIISVDNYFRDRDDMPLDADGKRDFEGIDAIDIAAFNKDMTALLEGKTVRMPTYDFLLGRRVYRGETLTMSEGDILIIEGIHCLNDALTVSMPAESKFKIYISALTQVNIDEHNRIAASDGRLLRRIVRDARTRGYAASSTLALWDSVRSGEEKNIFPFQDTADVFFNSALPYEIAVLKPYAEPLLFQVKPEDPGYFEARRLLKFLKYFIGVPSMELVPNTSLLREFIGGGCFRM
ncbi:MAG: nucleoside kinase [Lachnospiraceae bacterium]|nr:nucleoside kinase [Lachnospiraceae bacterium]